MITLTKQNKQNNTLNTNITKKLTNYINLNPANIAKIGTFEFKNPKADNKLINSQYMEFITEYQNNTYTYRAPLKYVNVIDGAFLLFIGDNPKTYQVFNRNTKEYYDVDENSLIELFAFEKVQK